MRHADAIAEVGVVYEQQHAAHLRELHTRERCYAIAQTLFAFIVIHGFTQESLDEIASEIADAERRGVI